MSLTDLPEWMQYLVIYGPLGLWSGLATYAYLREVRSHHATRDRHEKELKETGEKHTAEIKDLGATFGAKYAAQAEVHHDQIGELTDRFVGQNQEAYAQNRLVTEKVTGLLESWSRTRDRR